MHHATAFLPQTMVWMHPATASQTDAVVRMYRPTAMKPQALEPQTMVWMHPATASKTDTVVRMYCATAM